MAGDTQGKITVQADSEEKIYTIIDASGQIHRGTVVIKPVYCGKRCEGCPHKFYKYIAWRQDGKTKWKYIGRVEKGKEQS